MLHVDLVNLDITLRQLGTKFPEAVKRGTSLGIEKYSDFLAGDVAAHTPVKSGRARDSVYSKMRNEMTGAVGYNTAEAFYVRFWLFGAKPHPIFPRGRKGSRWQRALSRQARRHGISAAVTAGELGSEAFSFAGRNLRRALLVNGRFFSAVNHPGIRAHMTLFRRLDETAGKANEIIRASIDSEIAREQ